MDNISEDIQLERLQRKIKFALLASSTKHHKNTLPGLHIIIIIIRDFLNREVRNEIKLFLINKISFKLSPQVRELISIEDNQIFPSFFTNILIIIIMIFMHYIFMYM